MIKTGVVILKNYEDNILQLKYEDLLQFLINDIVRGGFFNDTNYENYITISNRLEIKKGLIKNLENEYSQQEKLKELDDEFEKSEKRGSFDITK